MKKLFLLPLLGLFFMACSVENEDLNLPENQILELNATNNTTDYCGTSSTYDFNDYGHIEVANDGDFLYVTVVAWEGSYITNTKLHLANGISGFPTVGQGNLPPGQMAIKENFDSDKETHLFKFNLIEFDEYADEDGNGNQEIYIASKTNFTNGEGGWAGDLKGNSGGWSYLIYELQTCEVGEEPWCGFKEDEYSITLENSYVDEKVNDVGAINGFLLDNFFGIGTVPRDGSFDKTNSTLLWEYNIAINSGTWPIVISTTYTVGEGVCQDSVLLNLTITE